MKDDNPFLGNTRNNRGQQNIAEGLCGGSKAAVNAVHVSKTERMARAISGIDGVSHSIESLLDALRAHDSPGDSPRDEPPEHVSLDALLKTGPDVINSKVERCHNAIEQLRDILL